MASTFDSKKAKYLKTSEKLKEDCLARYASSNLNLTDQKMVRSAAPKKLLIDLKHPRVSVNRQCRLLGLSQ